MKISKYLDPQFAIPTIAVFLSLIFSYIRLSYHQPINTDGIIYLQSATNYLKNNLLAAMTTYPWPFYPILVAWLSKIGHLTLLHSAYLLNSILLAGIVAIFIMLVRELNGNKRTQIIAGLIILIFPTITYLRDIISRDAGYNLFALLSLLFLIRYLRHWHLKNALAWGISIVIATLFRIEGIFLQLLIPFIILFLFEQPFYSRWIHFLKIYSVNFMIFIGLGSWWLLNANYSSFQLGRLNEIINILPTAWQTISANLLQIKNLLNPLLGINSTQFLLGGILTTFIIIWLKALTPLYAFFSGYAFSCKLIPLENNARGAIYGYIAINLLILIGFMLTQLFITQRYCLLLNLILLLGVPFGLVTLYENWRRGNASILGKPWVIASVGLMLLGMFSLAIFPIGATKTYIREAGMWIQNNTPITSKFYINDAQLVYYSQRPGTRYPEDFTPLHDLLSFEQLQHTHLQDYDYAALLILKKQQTEVQKFVSNLPLQALQTFYNKRGDKIVIFKITT